MLQSLGLPATSTKTLPAGAKPVPVVVTAANTKKQSTTKPASRNPTKPGSKQQKPVQSQRPYVVPSLSRHQQKPQKPPTSVNKAPAATSAAAVSNTKILHPNNTVAVSAGSSSSSGDKVVRHVAKDGKLTSNMGKNSTKQPPPPSKVPSRPPPQIQKQQKPLDMKDIKGKWWINVAPVVVKPGKGTKQSLPSSSSSSSVKAQLVDAPDEESTWYTSTQRNLVTTEILAGMSDNAADAASAPLVVASFGSNVLEEIMTAVNLAYTQEANIYQQNKRGRVSSDRKWINDVMTAGTVSDKVAALALVVAESPIHELTALDDLIAMAGKKEHRTCQLALEALKDLLIHNLLPDRPLRKFKQQPLAHPIMNLPSALVFWYEEQLLLRMDRFADALDQGLKSTVDFFKKKCMELAAELLISKPQHEGRFLSMVVNKLGDPSGPVSSKGIELLRGVVRKQPPMKCVVVREVRQLLHRPNLPVRAVHAGIVFLSQVMMPVMVIMMVAVMIITHPLTHPLTHPVTPSHASYHRPYHTPSNTPYRTLSTHILSTGTFESYRRLGSSYPTGGMLHGLVRKSHCPREDGFSIALHVVVGFGSCFSLSRE